MNNKFANWFFVCLISFVAIFVYACGAGSTTATGSTGTIVGTIYAADGTTPVPACSVYLATDVTKIATTDSVGAFSFSGSWITAGTYNFIAAKGSVFQMQFAVTVSAAGATTDTGSKEFDSTDSNVTVPTLGVVLGSYDQIEDIIVDLGYSFITLEVSDLNDYTYISTFDAIFINCTSSPGSGWTASGETAVQNFVEVAGKSLYVSDWSATYVETIWPTAVNWYGGSVSAAKQGNMQTLTAEVIDSSLQTVLGKTTAEVFYDLSSWVIISSEGVGTDVLLTGYPNVATVYSAGVRSSNALSIAGTLEAVPLAVKFQPGGATKGLVIYTTFHNEAQASNVTADARKILEDFIFRL